MTVARVFDARGRGFNFDPSGSVLSSDATETLVSDQPIGGGYFVAETSVEGFTGIDTVDYLYFYNSGLDQIIYERIEFSFAGEVVTIFSDLMVSAVDLARNGIEALFKGNDQVIGNSFNDRIYGFSGDDVLFGGGGTDTAAYFGDQTSYTLTLSPNSTTVFDRRADGDGTDQLIDFELLDFRTDLLGGPFDLTKFGGPTGLAQQDFESFIELYIAYFNRAPDAIGLNFWGTAFANGLTLEQMAAEFGPQEETQVAYPPGTSNEVFATTVYNNVLGRTPDQAGIDFWVGQLDAGNVSRDQFILQVLQGAKSELKPELGPEFVGQQLNDRAYLENKIDIGAYFAVHKGMSNVENAAAAMSLFDGTLDSITNAVSAIDGYYADALSPTDGEFLMQLVGVLDDPFSA